MIKVIIFSDITVCRCYDSVIQYQDKANVKGDVEAEEKEAVSATSCWCIAVLNHKRIAIVKKKYYVCPYLT